MIRLFVYLIGLLVAGQAGLAMAATSLVFENGELIGAHGLAVGDQIYNVEFVDGSCVDLLNGCNEPSDFPFSDETSAHAASGTLAALLEREGWDTMPGLIRGCEDACSLLTPFGLIQEPELDVVAVDLYIGLTACAWTWNCVTPSGNETTSPYRDTSTRIHFVYALWTVSTALYVDDDDPTCGGLAPCFQSIGSAINEASDGDRIQVLPGFYTENLHIVDKWVTLRSVAGAEQTVIDGDAGASVIVVHDGADVTIEGFTLQNGGGVSTLVEDGFGVFVGGFSSSRAIVKNNIIHTNRSFSNSTQEVDGGGGVAVNSSNVDVHIEVEVAGNVVHGNFKGIDVELPNSPTVTGHVKIRNNLIVSNQIVVPDISGGGITINACCSFGEPGTLIIEVSYNTIYGNWAHYGGGLSVGASSLSIFGNILNGNSAVQQGDDIYAPQAADTVRIEENLIGDGQFDGIDRNSSADPQFTDPAGFDFVPAFGSPAMDVVPPGSEGCATTLVLDPTGTSRPQGAACDVGALETPQTAERILASFQRDMQPGWPKEGWLYLYNTSPIDSDPTFEHLQPTTHPYFLYSRTGDSPRLGDLLHISRDGGHPGHGSTQWSFAEYTTLLFTVPLAGYVDILNSRLELVDPAGTTENSDGLHWFSWSGAVGTEAGALTAGAGSSISFDRHLGYLDVSQVVMVGIGANETDYYDTFSLAYDIVLNLDKDNDLMADAFEHAYGFDPEKHDEDNNGVLDGRDDADGDDLSNEEEALLGTSPIQADTDGDGIEDAAELSDGTDPLDSSDCVICSSSLVLKILPHLLEKRR